MQTFRVVFRFPLMRGVEDLDEVQRLIREAEELNQVQRTLSGIALEYPLAVEIDGEEWLGVAPTSADTHELIVAFDAAKMTDDVLEGLAVVDHAAFSAAWVINNNEFTYELKPIAA